MKRVALALFVVVLALIALARVGGRGAATGAAPAEGAAPAADVERVELAEAGAAAAATAETVSERSALPRDVDERPQPSEPLATEWAEPDTVRLHVRDRETGRPLDGIVALELERWFGRSERPGRAAGRAEERGASPVLVERPAPDETRVVFARAPGHAWGVVRIGAEPDERVLELALGGDLVVRVVGPRDPGTIVRVLSQGAPIAEEELHVAEELAFEALPAGALEVAAQIGEREYARDLIRTAVEVVPGASTSVTLALPLVEAARWVPLAGSLVVPPQWELDAFQLDFLLLGSALERWSGEAVVDRVEMTLADRDAGLYLWSARDVQPGRYHVGLTDLGFGAEIEVGAAGAEDVRLEIAPPCAVRLRCVDPETGGAVRAQLYWAWSGGGSPRFLVEVDGWDEERACFDFRVPCGEILVHALELGTPPRALQIAPGGSEHEIELAVFRLRVRLLDGAACVPWDPHLRATLETLAGAPVAAARIYDDRALVLAVAASGTYRVRVAPIDGYEPIPERIVEVRGAMTEVDVDLVRLR